MAVNAWINSSCRLKLLALIVIGLFIVAFSASSGVAASPEIDQNDKVEDEMPIESLTLTGSYLAARIAFDNDDLRKAARYFDIALSKSPDNLYFLERSFSLNLAIGNVDRGFVLAKELGQRFPNHGLARIVLAVKAIIERRFETAGRYLDWGETSLLNELTSDMLGAWILTGRGNFSGALNRLEKIDNFSNYPALRDFHIGLVHVLGGNTTKSLSFLKSAYERYPTHISFVEGYARELARFGQSDKAQSLLDAFNDDFIIDWLKGLIAAKGRIIAPLVSSPQSGAAELFYGLAGIVSNEGDNEAAVIYYNLALALNPNHSLARLKLAGIWEELSDYREANKILTQALETSPFKNEITILLAYNLAIEKNFTLAKKQLQNLLAVDPNNSKVLAALAGFEHDEKNYPKAITTLSRAIDLIKLPKRANWRLFFNRAVSYERNKQLDKAVQDLQKALKLNPDQPDVLNYIGYLWADNDQNLDQALKLITKAVKLKPGDAYFIDSLGWVYYRLGKYDDALKHLERAVKIMPSDPILNDHLGDIYWRIGYKLEARFQWQHALDLDPKPKMAKEIEKKLKGGLNPTAAGKQTNLQESTN